MELLPSASPKHSGVPGSHLPSSPTVLSSRVRGALPSQAAAMVIAPRMERAPGERCNQDLRLPHRKVSPPLPEPALPRSRDGAGRGHASLFCSLDTERRRARGLGRDCSFFHPLLLFCFSSSSSRILHFRLGFPSVGLAI